VPHTRVSASRTTKINKIFNFDIVINDVIDEYEYNDPFSIRIRCAEDFVMPLLLPCLFMPFPCLFVSPLRVSSLVSLVE